MYQLGFGRKLLALACLLAVAGCQRWVAPYNAGLQQRATTMLAQVTAWEASMATRAGTVQADPRNPAVSDQLDKWRGEIEAMAAIEAGIDPEAGTCDSVVRAILGPVESKLKRLGASVPAGSGSDAAAKTSLRCESLPDVFGKMLKVVKVYAPASLSQQCKLSWVPNSYFAGKSIIEGTNVPVPKGNAATRQARIKDAKSKCVALFEPLLGIGSEVVQQKSSQATLRVQHGPLLSPLATDLAAIIYREGQQAPTK